MTPWATLLQSGPGRGIFRGWQLAGGRSRNRGRIQWAPAIRMWRDFTSEATGPAHLAPLADCEPPRDCQRLQPCREGSDDALLHERTLSGRLVNGLLSTIDFIDDQRRASSHQPAASSTAMTTLWPSKSATFSRLKSFTGTGYSAPSSKPKDTRAHHLYPAR